MFQAWLASLCENFTEKMVVMGAGYVHSDSAVATYKCQDIQSTPYMQYRQLTHGLEDSRRENYYMQRTNTTQAGTNK